MCIRDRNYLIETRGLCKQYGAAMRVKNLHMAVPEGAIYGFLGPNGAGKSTTLKMLLGLVHPTNGEITVFGRAMNAKNRLEILRNTGSVSYTHLDVYKRQGRHAVPLCGQPVC